MWLIKIGSKNGNRIEACLEETRLHVEIMITILGSKVNTIGDRGGGGRGSGLMTIQ